MRFDAGVSGDDAACFCGGFVSACCGAAGGGEFGAAACEARSKESEACSFGEGGGSGCFSASCFSVTSSGVTRSTAMDSAVTEPKG